ncbi:hypothetical protein [Phytoactinopolyspora halotolerans]|uniref:Uncharacterized protein n=1 Tax=Phytoactinopolyspora halotolerans TaxID=1981512 RepID=A0A6L9SEA9_9ACTN|nr:hypothetical protein [Phytoactinopolyspora halotolerans]NEE02852.1 hypothetical protein [Phytoactinopolyspora halotolerans]
MNGKQVIKVVGSAFGAFSALRAFSKARHEGDRLKMLDAGLSVASVAVTVAIIVREIREGDDHSRIVELEDREG